MAQHGRVVLGIVAEPKWLDALKSGAISTNSTAAAARTSSWRFFYFQRGQIGLLPLLGEPVVFRDPLLGFFLGMEFTEVARSGVRPRDFHAPMVGLSDRR
jgi:hypothetical protein